MLIGITVSRSAERTNSGITVLSFEFEFESVLSELRSNPDPSSNYYAEFCGEARTTSYNKHQMEIAQVNPRVTRQFGFRGLGLGKPKKANP